MKITIDGTRYDLGTMVALRAKTRENGGISIEEMFFGPRSHRLIIETYSIWEDRAHPGCVIGTRYAVIEPGGYGWVDSMQRALDLCDPEHEDILRAAMDEHAPALEG